MMSNVKELKSSDDQGSEVVVKVLERMLKEAKKGEYIAICVTVISSDGSNEWYTGGKYSPSQLVGSLEATKYSILSEE